MMTVDIYAEFGNYAFDVLTEIVYGCYFKEATIRPAVSYIQLGSTGLVSTFGKVNIMGRFLEGTFLLSPGHLREYLSRCLTGSALDRNCITYALCVLMTDM